MGKRKEQAKYWPPKREVVEVKWDEGELVNTLSTLSGMNRELAERMANDGNWPAEAGELAQRYGLSQMDAEAVLKVLNVNRGASNG